MLKKLLIAAAAVVLVPTGTALADQSGRHGYYGGHYYGDGYRYRAYRHGHRLNRFDRQLRDLRYAYENGYISRSEYRYQRRVVEQERRWFNRHNRDRRYGYRW